MRNYGFGYLAKEPDLIERGSTVVCNFTLATIEKRYSNGEKIENTHFLPFEVWDSAAKFLYENAEPGDTVYVEDSIPREYKNKIVFRVTDFRLIKKNRNAS